MKNVFYHYTNVKKASQILGVSEVSASDANETGLIPRRPFINHAIDKRFPIHPLTQAKATFGLIEEVPMQWATERSHHDVLLFEEILDDMRGEGRVLLQIDFTSQDEVYVGDVGIYLVDAFAQSVSAQEKDEMSARLTQERCESLIPWQEYHGKNLNYRLPEVVCFSRISPEKIKVCRVFNDAMEAVNRFREKGDLPLRERYEPHFDSALKFLKKDMS